MRKLSELKMKGTASTIAVMEFIRENEIKEMDACFFEFEDGLDIVVSSVTEEEIGTTMLVNPFNTWNDYNGIRWIKPLNDLSIWYFWIDGTYYYMTI